MQHWQQQQQQQQTRRRQQGQRQRLDRSAYVLEFSDEFEGTTLNETRWLPYYLPHWSSRERSRARHHVADGMLHLRIDADQPAWAPYLTGGLRVSNLQTGSFAGPLGSTIGQHRFAPGLTVRQEQPEARLYLPHRSLVEARVAVPADPRTMAALWMIGFEDSPERSAEVCVFEIFGGDIRPDSANTAGAGGTGRTGVGCGIHPFGDPRITDDFRRPVLPIDARDFHTYSVDWAADGLHFWVDDTWVTSIDQSPDYPMQLMLDIYEFEEPIRNGQVDRERAGRQLMDRGQVDDADRRPPEMLVEWVRGWRRK